MRYWFDTEFIEDGRTIDLISIGIVAEDGREYYAINSECSLENASDWVWENVLYPVGLYQPLPYINLSDPDCSPLTRQSLLLAKARQQIKEEILMFFAWNATSTENKTATKTAEECYKEAEIWAYYADYDWVVFCQLFGTMMDLPEGFPMYCRDIKQWCDMLGNPELPKHGKGEHNALEDARWNKQAWEFLDNLSGWASRPE